MSIIRCAITAAAVGKLGQQDRSNMERLWQRAYADAQSRGLHSANAEEEANEAVRGALKHVAWVGRRNATLQLEAWSRLKEDAARFRNRKGQADVGEYGLHLVNRVFFRAHAGFQIDMAELGALANAFGRTVLSGTRKNRARMDLMVRELFGEDTGDATAKTLAEAWAALSRRKMEQFNAAGGDVPIREDWHMPQMHDAISIGRAGANAWKDFIRERLDPEKMTNPVTGQKFRGTELEEALDDVYENITWNGLGQNEGTVGSQSLAIWRRRADPRFFAFKDADSYLSYMARFGSSQNPFEVMTSYLRSINHDLAAMQMLGPNPEASIHRLAGTEDAPGGVIFVEARKADEGKAAIFPAQNDAGFAFKGRERQQYAKDKAIGTVRAWQSFTGAARRPFHNGWADAEGSVNNLLYANLLPFTPFLVGGDIMNQAATRAFTSVSVAGMMRDLVEALRLSRDNKALQELGVEIDVGLSTMLSEARDHAVTQGAPWSRWIVDRTMTFTGLKPMTLGMRAMWTLGVLHDVTRHQATAFDRLPKAFRATLLRHDIDAGAWEFIQAASRSDIRGVKVVRPQDIANVDVFALSAGADGVGETVRARAGLTRGQEVAMRLATLIKEEGEAAVISGTPRSARILPFRPGSISGSVLGSFSRLKTYAISHFQHHAFRAAEIFWREGSGVRGTSQAGLYYFGQLLLPSMALVAAGTVIAEMVKGNNPPDVTSNEFAEKVFWKTVSLGLMQDLIQSTTDPESRDLSQAMGPTMDRLGDVMTLGRDALKEGEAAATGGEDTTHTGRQFVKVLKGWVPRHWATDLAVQRLIWDNLQRMVDPEADDALNRAANRVKQGMWAPPGQPVGAPDLSTMDLSNQRAN